jgi:hypothetical protein
LPGASEASEGMRRWQGNGRGLLWPRRLGLAEAESAKRLSAEGASPALTSKHPKRRVAWLSSQASTREEDKTHKIVGAPIGI